jgi:SWIM zinc finger
MEAQNQNNHNVGSEIAAFLRQWDQEMEELKLLAHGYAETARHDFISKRMSAYFTDERMVELMTLEAKKEALKAREQSMEEGKSEVSDDALQKKQTKAQGYVSEPEWFTIFFVEMEVRAEDGNQLVLYGNEDWSCSCDFFREQKTCDHVMAVGRVLKALTITQPRGNVEKT